MGDSNDGDSEAPWESASNDQAFRAQTKAKTKPTAEERAPQTTGESSSQIASVRWDIEEDNSNNYNNIDVSFLTSDDTANVPQSNAYANVNANANAFERRSLRSKRSVSYFLHAWDIAITVFWVVFVAYHLSYNKNNEHSRSMHMILLLIISVLLAVLNAMRGFLWVWASLPSLSKMCCCGCCCNGDDYNHNDNQGIKTVSKLATNLTLWLGIVYGVISVVALFGPSSWLPWCDGFGSWCHKLIPIHTGIPIAFVVTSMVEMFRWVFLQGQLVSSPSSLTSNQIADYYNDDVMSSHSESSRHRPWWFNRHSRNPNNTAADNLHEPLMETGGVGSTTNRQPSWALMSWIPFRRSRNVNGNTNTNANDGDVINGDEEDVESVLNSLGEDWASRAESDPYWWTR